MNTQVLVLLYKWRPLLINRCPQSEAYERRQDPNGMYMKHLLKYVMNDAKVEDVLHQVAGGMSWKLHKMVCNQEW